MLAAPVPGEQPVPQYGRASTVTRCLTPGYDPSAVPEWARGTLAQAKTVLVSVQCQF